jgi:hypothetical protein
MPNMPPQQVPPQAIMQALQVLKLAGLPPQLLELIVQALQRAQAPQPQAGPTGGLGMR